MKKSGRNPRIPVKKKTGGKPGTLLRKNNSARNTGKERDSEKAFKSQDSAEKKTRPSEKKPFRKNSPRLVIIKKRTENDQEPYKPRDKAKYEKRPYKKRIAGNNSKTENPGNDYDRNSLFPGSKPIRLNKYIANAGICSRRDADILIESGAIKVNGAVITTLGIKIKPGDHVEYDGQILRGEQLRYILLNKPKGFICTVEDPHERKTVMSLVERACTERVYPVGRLDRNTTGLLLFTNDGDLAKKLTHPKHRVRKVYQVELDKTLAKNDIIRIAEGVELDDGFIMPDAIAYAEAGEDKKKIGIEIHSGRNRIVRRIFEKFGYDVKKLDRVVFANLTKKDLPRGKWRHLAPTEINILRRIN
jgi:23S rRNA pseudouridine2605 synthase